MHQEALTNKGQEIFSRLEGFEGYYLAGGTALALQIGHRISVDFDFFYSENIPKDLLRKIKTIFKQSPVAVSVNNPDELSVFIDGTKTSFIKYPFPVLLPFVNMNGINLLSIKELAATKSYTIGRRGSFKDYVDLFFILQEGHSSLEEILELAEKKYGQEFNGRLFLEQLTYTQDVEDAEIILLKNKSINRNLVFNFLYQEVGKIKI